MKKIIILFIVCILVNSLYSQTTNDILNVLTVNGTITQETADSLRADAALKQQDAEASKKAFQITSTRPIQIAGYTQVRYQILDEKGKKDGFDIRRARIDVKGNLTPFFAYRLQTDFADKPKIIDAYAEIKIADFFTITAGQFKIPFSLENLTSSSKFELIDRSQVVEALTARGKDVIGNQNGRDIGIQLGGVLIKKGTAAILEYRLGVFNGSGINVADTANESKDVAGRLIVNPVKGLSVAASYYNGRGKAIKPATEFKGKIAEGEKIPQRFLETILLELRKLGILGSKLGKEGGYFLLKKPSEVTLAEIVRHFEGTIALMYCVSEKSYQPCEFCKDENTCQIRRVFKEVRDTTFSILAGTTLEDIIKLPVAK